MRNLMKKSLACCLAIALCLTAMVGITVSAAEVEATITVEDVTAIAADNLIVDVDFELAAKDGSDLDLSEAFLEASVSKGAKIVGIEAESGMVVTITNGIINFYPDSLDERAYSAKVTLQVAVPNAVDTYTVTVGVADVGAATWGEDLVVAADATGTITVKAPHVHNVGYINNENGTHTTKCDAEGCEGFEAATTDCTYVDGVCSACGYVKPAEGPVEKPELASTFRSKGAMISNTFGINFQVRIKAADLESYGADTFEIRITKQEFDTTNFTYKENPQVIVFKPEDTIGSAQFTKNGIYIYEQGFALYEVQVPLTYSVHLFKDGEEIAYHNYLTTTLTEIANERYDQASAGSDTDVKVRKMIVALLNVATTVKKVFANKANTAENSPLKTGDAPNAHVDTVTYAVPYDTLTASEVVKGAKTRDLSVAINAAPSLFYEFRDTTLKDLPEEFYVQISYFSKYKNDTLNFRLNGTELTNRGYGIYNFNFTETCLYDTDKDVTITVYKNDGTVVDTATCNINSLLLAKVGAVGDSGDAYRAVASLAVHCREFYPNY